MIHHTAVAILLLCATIVCALVPFNKTAFPIFQSFVSNLCANKIVIDEAMCSTSNSTTEPIVCDKDGNIVAINLNRKPCLGGIITSHIALLDRLQTLDLRDALVGGSIPSEIAQCKALTSLLTAGNNLRGLVPEGLAYMRLSYCTLMRNFAENNCFDCPVPKLNCTATLRCNSTCLVGFTTGNNLSTAMEYLTKSTSTDKPFTEEATKISTLLATESETELFQSTTTTATAKTYQQKTQTLLHGSETKTTESDGGALLASPEQSNESVSLIIGLSFALGVTVPIILVLLCLYGKSKRTRRIPPIIGIDDYAKNKKSDEPEVRMNVVSGNYGAVAARNETNYNAVEVHTKKHNVQYDVVPVHTPGEYDSVYSVFVE